MARVLVPDPVIVEPGETARVRVRVGEMARVRVIVGLGETTRVRVRVIVGLNETARVRVGETVVVEKARPSITNRDTNLIIS